MLLELKVQNRKLEVGWGEFVGRRLPADHGANFWPLLDFDLYVKENGPLLKGLKE